MPLARFALTLAAFAIGTTEFVTFIGQHFGWHSAFLAVAAFGLTTLSGRLDRRAALAQPLQT
jgi:predicted MFS family arabinose efflux permease